MEKKYLAELDLNGRRRGSRRSAGVEAEAGAEGSTAGVGEGEERGGKSGAGGGRVLGGFRVVHCNSWGAASAARRTSKEQGEAWVKEWWRGSGKVRREGWQRTLKAEGRMPTAAALTRAGARLSVDWAVGPESTRLLEILHGPCKQQVCSSKKKRQRESKQ